MRLLTLDLGITTGYCCREMNGDLLSLGTIDWPDTSDDPGDFYDPQTALEKSFYSLVNDHLPSYVVCEAPVLIARGELQGNLQLLIAAAKAVFRNNTEWVTPAQWKPRYGKTSIKIAGRTLSAHEKDAFRIAEWWLKSRQVV